MTNFTVRQRARISDTSSPAYSPQECGCHGLSNSLGVSLFVNDPKCFGVNTQKQLCDTLSRKARLHINDCAVIHYLAVRSMEQFAIGPQPKRRSTMRHFLLIPLPGELAKNAVSRFKYCGRLDASIHSYKHYRSNVLAERSLGVGGTLETVRRAPGMFRG